MLPREVPAGLSCHEHQPQPPAAVCLVLFLTAIPLQHAPSPKEQRRGGGDRPLRLRARLASGAPVALLLRRTQIHTPNLLEPRHVPEGAGSVARHGDHGSVVHLLSPQPRAAAAVCINPSPTASAASSQQREHGIRHARNQATSARALGEEAGPAGERGVDARGSKRQHQRRAGRRRVHRQVVRGQLFASQGTRLVSDAACRMLAALPPVRYLMDGPLLTYGCQQGPT
jgi:hypothetical protein